MTAEEEFRLKEYEALRAEILSTQRRSFQTMSAGLFGLPAANYLIHKPGFINEPYANLLMIGLPFVVIVIALLWLGDNNGIIRIGQYIRDVTERKLLPAPYGWENFLEHKPQHTRNTERHVTIAVYILFLLYYGAAVTLAWQPVQQRVGEFTAVGVMIAYATIGIGASIYFVKEELHSTEVAKQRMETPPPRKSPVAPPAEPRIPIANDEPRREYHAHGAE